MRIAAIALALALASTVAEARCFPRNINGNWDLHAIELAEPGRWGWDPSLDRDYRGSNALSRKLKVRRREIVNARVLDDDEWMHDYFFGGGTGYGERYIRVDRDCSVVLAVGQHAHWQGTMSRDKQIMSGVGYMNFRNVRVNVIWNAVRR